MNQNSSTGWKKFVILSCHLGKVPTTIRKTLTSFIVTYLQPSESQRRNSSGQCSGNQSSERLKHQIGDRAHGHAPTEGRVLQVDDVETLFAEIKKYAAKLS